MKSSGTIFKRRMDRTFTAMGLRAEEHCVWLPEMDVLDYWNLLRLGDVCLDTLGWSGGVSTFEAIACGLPVVTVPGQLMRSRHSCAILTQLGVTETIARDEVEYVEIAVRLGLDREWRQAVIDRSQAGYPALYSDSRNIRALEDFLQTVVANRTGPDRSLGRSFADADDANFRRAQDGYVQLREAQSGRTSSASKREYTTTSEGALSNILPSHSTQAWD